MRHHAFPIFIKHPVHAPTLPRSCGSQEELDLLTEHGWYIDGDNPSPIPSTGMPPTNADETNRPEALAAAAAAAAVASNEETDSEPGDDDADNPDDVDETVDALVDGKKKRKKKKA